MATRTYGTSPMPYSRKTSLSTLTRATAQSGQDGGYYGYRSSSFRDRYLKNISLDMPSTYQSSYQSKYVPSVMSRTRRPSVGSVGCGPSSTLYNDRSTTTRPPATTTFRYQSPSRASSYDLSSYPSGTSTTRLGGVTSILPSATSTLSHRPLPHGGPGPLDERGRKIDIQDALSRNRRSESVGGIKPVKAMHSHFTGGSPRRHSPATDLTSKPPTSLTKRTSSISNLTTELDNINLSTSTSTTPLGRRGRAGSHTDLSGDGTSARTPDADLYDTGSARITLAKNYYNAGSHTYDYDKDSESQTEHSVLPPVKKTGGLATRSPSQDRLTDETRATARRTVITNGTSSRSNILERHNSRESPEATTSNGLVGLKNLGNTCFMNSIVQCLSHTRLMRDYCLSDEYKDDINRISSSSKGALVTAFTKVLKSLWKSGETYVSPTEFKSQIAKVASRFVGYNQQDSQEFLIYLLEGLHEDVNRVTTKKKPVIVNEDGEEKISASEKATQTWKRYLDRDNSKIVDLFVGQLKSALKCTSCSYTSNTFDPFWDLSLPIKKRGSEVTLSDCFELFTQEESLDGDEKPTCARCKTRRKCTKSFSIQRFPKILIIHLKRFNPESFIRAKLSTLVDFPLKDLDLSKFAAEKSQAPVLYNLYAVSNHSGTTFSGHYTAYCKGSKNNDWSHFSDTRVNQIGSNHIRSSEAYVLFYELSSGSHPARL